MYVENRRLTEAENIALTPALDMGIHLPALINGKSIGTYIDELTISRQKLLDALDGISFEDFSRTFESEDYHATCNLAWLLFHMLEDEIYHRGQISMIKKMLTEKREKENGRNTL